MKKGFITSGPGWSESLLSAYAAFVGFVFYFIPSSEFNACL